MVLDTQTKDTEIENRHKNINIDGVENCNLLCKLIIDYIPSNKCIIKQGCKNPKDLPPQPLVPSPSTTIDSTATTAPPPPPPTGPVSPSPSPMTSSLGYQDDSANSYIPMCENNISYSYLDLPPGSFINYRDTSYEATRAVFFQPSRHMIDNEQFDFEVNIYHGTFIEGSERKGIVSHAHYKSDTETHNTYNNKFHYHTNEKEDQNHQPEYVPESQNNLVTCILFNISDHKGTNSNVFFNQFVNNLTFKHKDFSQYPIKVRTHNNWSIEDMLPARRSFFMYEDKHKKNTYLVFDSINSIDKGIVDILKNHIYPKPDIDKFYVPHINTILYKSNIEVITDQKYKKRMREEIKLLLGTYRSSMRISDPNGTSRDYNKKADELYNEIFSGRYRNYRDDSETSLQVTNAWSEWAKGKKVEVSINKQIENSKIQDNIENSDYADFMFNQNYDYLKLFEDSINILDKISSGSVAPQYKNLDTYREILFRFNFEVINVSYMTLPKKIIPLEELGIKSLNTNLDIMELMKYMNFNHLTIERGKPVRKKIYIIGYQGNYNFYIGDIPVETQAPAGSGATPEGLTVDNHPDIKKLNNLFYVSDIPENLNTYDQSNLHFTKNPIIIEYELNLLPHTVLNTYLDHTTAPKIDSALNPGYISDNWLDYYRLLIQTNKSFEYTANADIFHLETISFLKTDLPSTTAYFKTAKNIIPIKSRDTFEYKSGAQFNQYQIIMPESFLKFVTLKVISVLSPSTNLTVFNTGMELNTTINGDVCQNWNSHQVHHESHSFLDHFRKVPKFFEGGKGLDTMTFDEKDHIKDGLLKGIEQGDKIIFKTHNKCRNPGNKRSAPWCYTKNPNKRWDYCVKPDHSMRFSKYVLLFTTLLFIALAYTTVKMIFKKEYFTAFIARLTGGSVGGGGGGGSGGAKASK